MEISARIFGVNAWSILAPQALEGVAAVGLLYPTMRRAVLGRRRAPGRGGAGPHPGGHADVPVQQPRRPPRAAAHRRPPTPRSGPSRAAAPGGWSLAGALVGFGFITKMLQALVVRARPRRWCTCWPGPPASRRRIVQLLAAGVALVVSAGWWVAAVQLTPAADRPYIGGSQNNSLLNLIFGYNGFGRLTGNETGSVGGGAGRPRSGGSMWGPTGLCRMFNSEFGTQISWLLPAALAAIVVGLWITRRTRRTDPVRAAFLLWGTWLLVTGLVFSLGQGIIHPYYSVALAPAVGGAGRRRRRPALGPAGPLGRPGDPRRRRCRHRHLGRRPPAARPDVERVAPGDRPRRRPGRGRGPGARSDPGSGVDRRTGRRAGRRAQDGHGCRGPGPRRLPGRPGRLQRGHRGHRLQLGHSHRRASSGGGFGGGPRFGGGAFRGARERVGPSQAVDLEAALAALGGAFGGGAGLAPPGAGGGLAGGGAGLAGGGLGRGPAPFRRPLRSLRRRWWAGGRGLRWWGAGRPPLGERPRQGPDRRPRTRTPRSTPGWRPPSDPSRRRGTSWPPGSR